MEKLIFNCPGLKENGMFALKHTGRGDDVSPAFEFENLSPDAKTIAIMLEDLDVKIPFMGTLAHWLVWNIPATPIIPQAMAHGKTLADGSTQGICYGKHKYAGPRPPYGKQHHYKFTVYALNAKINLQPNTKKKQFLQTIAPHIIQQGELTEAFLHVRKTKNQPQLSSGTPCSGSGM